VAKGRLPELGGLKEKKKQQTNKCRRKREIEPSLSDPIGAEGKAGHKTRWN